MDDFEKWLIKMMALLSLLMGGSDFSKMARHSLKEKAKVKAKEALEFGKKIVP
jgi:hypothetical protein